MFVYLVYIFISGGTNCMMLIFNKQTVILVPAATEWWTMNGLFFIQSATKEHVLDYLTWAQCHPQCSLILPFPQFFPICLGPRFIEISD